MKFQTVLVNLYGGYLIKSLHVKKCKIPDSRPLIPDCNSLSVEHGPDSGFQSLVGSVLDSLSCIPDSKAQDSGFHELNFPRFRIPHAKILRISESVFPYTGRIKGGSRKFWAVQVLLRYTSWSCYGCRPRAIIWLLRVGPWCHDALSNDVMWHDATTGSPSSVLARV